jgi:hypothetical protein
MRGLQAIPCPDPLLQGNNKVFPLLTMQSTVPGRTWLPEPLGTGDT